MPFPVVEDFVASSDGTPDTTVAATMPTTVNSGDMLISIIGMYDIDDPGLFNFTPASGWTNKRGGATSGAPGTWGGLVIAAKIADGTEGGTTVNHSTDDAVRDAIHTYRISGARSTLDGLHISTITVDTGSANPNPPSYNPGIGADDFLWLPCGMAFDDGQAWTAAPANYTDLKSTAVGGENSGVSVGSARRELNTASEDPGAFTLESAERCLIVTMAIQPAGKVATGVLVAGAAQVSGIADLGNKLATGALQADAAVVSGEALTEFTHGFFRLFWRRRRRSD